MMKKLRLAVEELQVESYAPADTPEPRGTVEANDYPYTDEEQIGTCGCGGTRLCTAAMTCAWTCWMIDTCEPGVCW
jgi:hypothetical protein